MRDDPPAISSTPCPTVPHDADTASRRHPNVRIEAHKVYNEYIQDKHHIHMNSTKWLTLTEYVKYLGREGICKVEDTPKGWFIQLVHRDPEQARCRRLRCRRRTYSAPRCVRCHHEGAC